MTHRCVLRQFGKFGCWYNALWNYVLRPKYTRCISNPAPLQHGTRLDRFLFKSTSRLTPDPLRCGATKSLLWQVIDRYIRCASLIFFCQMPDLWCVNSQKVLKDQFLGLWTSAVWQSCFVLDWTCSRCELTNERACRQHVREQSQTEDTSGVFLVLV